MPTRTERPPAAPWRARLGSATLAALLLAGCAPEFRVQVLQPGFDGSRTVRMEGNALDGGARVTPRVELNLERVDEPEREPRLYALVQYTGPSWLSVPDGPTLTLVVDGDTLRLAGPGSVRDRTVLHGHTALERARYPI
jgi:hypothetical protein